MDSSDENIEFQAITEGLGFNSPKVNFPARSSLSSSVIKSKQGAHLDFDDSDHFLGLGTRSGAVSTPIPASPTTSPSHPLLPGSKVRRVAGPLQSRAKSKGVESEKISGEKMETAATATSASAHPSVYLTFDPYVEELAASEPLKSSSQNSRGSSTLKLPKYLSFITTALSYLSQSRYTVWPRMILKLMWNQGVMWFSLSLVLVLGCILVLMTEGISLKIAGSFLFLQKKNFVLVSTVFGVYYFLIKILRESEKRWQG